MRRKILLGTLSGVVLLCLLIQLIPYGRINPPVVREPEWDSPQTRALAVRACYDCHSNETARSGPMAIAPLSWGFEIEIRDAREALNFSEWDRDQPGVGQTIADIETGRMPSEAYVKYHPEASLTPEEKAALIAGLKATLDQ